MMVGIGPARESQAADHRPDSVRGVATQDTVVLVHGLWTHGVVMELIRRRLARLGYRAVSYSYPSIRLGLAENAQRLVEYCGSLQATRVDFVAHSLGGLVVLRALERLTCPGRVVMLGTPYVECHAARRLARLPGGRTALGRSIPEWLEASRPTIDGHHEIGVIAGSLRLGLGSLVAPDLPAPSDGAVSVEETRFPGMRDHIVLNVSHSGMLVSRAVARQIATFLREGCFAHEGG
jgi:pimeloyl-ACP methyl ester carboxylesterase